MKKIFAALILTVCASMGYAADFYGNYGYGGGQGCQSGRCPSGQCPSAGSSAPVQGQMYYPQGGQGYSQGFYPVNPQGYSQAYPQGYSQGYSQSYPQGYSQGYYQGYQSSYPQGQYQSYPQGPYQQYQSQYDVNQPALYQGRFQGQDARGQDFRSGQSYQGQGFQSYSQQRSQGATRDNVQGQREGVQSSSYAPATSNY